MAKVHLKVKGVDARGHGQTQFEYDHQAACGYVRDNVTSDIDDVDCFYCLRSKEMQERKINKSLTKEAVL